MSDTETEYVYSDTDVSDCESEYESKRNSDETYHSISTEKVGGTGLGGLASRQTASIAVFLTNDGDHQNRKSTFGNFLMQMTSASEQQNVKVLNTFFEELSDAIFMHMGISQKYKACASGDINLEDSLNQLLYDLFDISMNAFGVQRMNKQLLFVCFYRIGKLCLKYENFTLLEIIISDIHQYHHTCPVVVSDEFVLQSSATELCQVVDVFFLELMLCRNNNNHERKKEVCLSLLKLLKRAAKPDLKQMAVFQEECGRMYAGLKMWSEAFQYFYDSFMSYQSVDSCLFKESAPKMFKYTIIVHMISLSESLTHPSLFYFMKNLDQQDDAPQEVLKLSQFRKLYESYVDRRYDEVEELLASYLQAFEFDGIVGVSSSCEMGLLYSLLSIVRNGILLTESQREATSDNRGRVAEGGGGGGGGSGGLSSLPHKGRHGIKEMIKQWIISHHDSSFPVAAPYFEEINEDKQIMMDFVELNGNILQFCSENLMQDLDVVQLAVNMHGTALQHVHPKVMTGPIGRQLVQEALKQNTENLGLLKSTEFKDDVDLVREAVTKNGLALKFATPRLQESIDIVMIAIEQNVDARKFMGHRLNSDVSVCSLILTKSQDIELFRRMPTSVRHERSIALLAVEIDGLSLNCLGDRNRSDFDIVLAAVKQNGHAIQYANFLHDEEKTIVYTAFKYRCSEKCLGRPNANRGDREIVVLNGNLHASQELKNNQDVMKQAISKCGLCYQFASNALQLSSEFTLFAIETCGCEEDELLNNAPIEMLSSREIMWSAVSYNGLSLHYASSKLQNDYELVTRAVYQCPNALQYCSQELANNYELVKFAVDQHWSSLEYASNELKSNTDIVLSALAQSPFALQYASDQVKKNKKIILSVVASNGRALEFASPELQSDLNVVTVALADTPRALLFVSKELLSDNKNRMSFSLSTVQHSWFAKLPFVPTTCALSQHFNSCIDRYSLNKQEFMSSFLAGWRPQTPTVATSTNPKSVNNSKKLKKGDCCLTILQKLGRYDSITVKLMIAEYAGVKLGLQWKKLHDASKNVTQSRLTF